jgi:acetyl esterase/lipase
VPSTVSEPARQLLQLAQKAQLWKLQVPAPGDLEGWKKLRAALEAAAEPGVLKAIERNEVTVSSIKLGGVPALDVKPKAWRDNGRVIVFLHGGAYTINSARSGLPHVAPVARASGMRVVSVDYTKAPLVSWKEMQEEVVDVFKALLAQGYRMKDIAIYSASAGGGLATSTVLNLRDCGMGMPAAVVLWSPWVDKTIFLSGSARLYQKIDEAGQPAFFDIYEGMIHVFQQFPIPESDAAIRRSVEFMHKRLAGKDRAEQATIDGTSKPPQPVKLD